MGYVHYPANAEWLFEFKREFTSFPYGAHDDIVDCLSLLGQGLDSIHRAGVPVEEHTTSIYDPQNILDLLAEREKGRLGNGKRNGALRIHSST